MSESYPLKAGWNAIWLPLDVSHEEIEQLADPRIERIWRWNPQVTPGQFTTSPGEPQNGSLQWLAWHRADLSGTRTMTTFGANAAYIVEVEAGAPEFEFSLTGRPVPPDYRWARSGLNFFGFPMSEQSSPFDRNFDLFLSYSVQLPQGSDVFKYVGGPLASNPVEVTTKLIEPVERGQAYWIESSEYSDYYGPLKVTVGREGLAYGVDGSAVGLRIANVTTTAVDATLSLAGSADAPGDERPVAGAVPLRLRGSLDPSTAQFDFTDFAGPHVVSLAAGEEAELVFAVNRPAMIGNPGDLLQSILQVSDSEGISRIDLPVSAEIASLGGLWTGVAVIDQVDQVLASPVEQPDGSADVEVSRVADADAPAQFPIRLILHRDANGAVKLLQRAYFGPDNVGNAILTDDEAQLDAAQLTDARRISSASFPLRGNFPASGELGLGSAGLDVSVSLGAGMSTNPFLHTYHPDHDDTEESLTVTRALRFEFSDDPPPGISVLGWGSTILGGSYQETISGLRAQPITIKGTFLLSRISAIETLTE